MNNPAARCRVSQQAEPAKLFKVHNPTVTHFGHFDKPTWRSETDIRRTLADGNWNCLSSRSTSGNEFSNFSETS